MCQSKADGGRRCYGHAKAAYDRAKVKVEQTLAVREEAKRALDAFMDRHGPSAVLKDREIGAQYAVFQQAWQDTDPPYIEASRRLGDARVAFASTERGYLEVMAEADAVEDSARGLTGNRRAEAARQAAWIRTAAQAGRNARTWRQQWAAEIQQRHERDALIAARVQLKVGMNPAPGERPIITVEGRQYIVEGDKHIPLDEWHAAAREQVQQDKWTEQRDARADRRAREARLAQLPGDGV